MEGKYYLFENSPVYSITDGNGVRKYVISKKDWEKSELVTLTEKTHEQENSGEGNREKDCKKKGWLGSTQMEIFVSVIGKLRAALM